MQIQEFIDRVNNAEGEEKEQLAEAVRVLLRLAQPEKRGVRAWEPEIRELHSKGLTVVELAQATGWKEGTVRNRMSVLGLKANRLPEEAS